MRVLLPIMIVMGLLGVALSVAAPEAELTGDGGVTYVIPIKGEIERGLLYLVRRGFQEAEAAGADAIVFDMDTPGGRLDVTEQILGMLTSLKIKTYTYVNPNAISAGAIIAMGTDEIYMSPNGRIGDAMPVMMSPIPMGGVEAIPDDLKEKAVSPTAALMKSAAQRKGHDPDLAAAMVRAELEYKIGDKVICAKGELLTLTAEDATQLVGEEGSQKPLLALAIVDDIDALLEKVGRGRSRVVTMEVSPWEDIGRTIDSFPVSGILLALGLLAIYIEFKTPGFGLPGITGIILLAIWFWGHNIAGLAGMGEILLFMVGAALLFIEIFFIPGFGFVGASGIVLMMMAIFMAMVQHYPGTPWYVTPDADIENVTLNIGTTLLIIIPGAVLLAKYLPRTQAFGRIMLAAQMSSGAGYTAVPVHSGRAGMTGVADTALRPGGMGKFDEQRLNVITRGEFIEKGVKIVIVEEHGSRTVVEEIGGKA